MTRSKNKQKKLNIRKGDTVKIITGDNRGQQGKVLFVVPEKDRVIVEGINMAVKHTRPNQKNTQGGIVKKEAGIHISNVMLVDPASGNATRVGRKLNSDGKLQRFSKKSKELIKQ